MHFPGDGSQMQFHDSSRFGITGYTWPPRATIEACRPRRSSYFKGMKARSLYHKGNSVMVR